MHLNREAGRSFKDLSQYPVRCTSSSMTCGSSLLSSLPGIRTLRPHARATTPPCSPPSPR